MSSFDNDSFSDQAFSPDSFDLSSDVAVQLTGVAADPEIGDGSVSIQILESGGRWPIRFIHDYFVELAGVAAAPAIGAGQVDISVALVAAKPKRTRKTASSAKIDISIALLSSVPDSTRSRIGRIRLDSGFAIGAGAAADPAVAGGRIEAPFALLEEEMAILLAA